MRAIVAVLCLVASCYAEENVDELTGFSSAVCSGVPPGVIALFPYPGDCSKYYECVEGVPYIQDCPDGLYFNEVLQGCDHPETSGCSGLVCSPGVVDYYPYPGDCTKYIECFNGEQEIHDCPPNLWFNNEQKRCTSESQSNCGQYSTIQPTGSTGTPGGVCDDQLPGSINLFPYPGDCTRYIECVGSQETVLQCPPGLYFNDDRQMCDQPEYSGCNDTTSTTSTTPAVPSTPVDGINDPRCSDGNNDFWPDVDCTKFIECYNGHGYVLSCPSGLYFNPESKRCETPPPGVCGAATNTTSEPDTTTRSSVTPYPDCPWPSTGQDLYPYPGNCSLFIECITGEPIVEECPPDLWFNPTLEVCDYPWESGCTQEYAEDHERAAKDYK